MPGFRIDGNDVLANYLVTRKAREVSLQRSSPVLIEAITYRVGHHSTSDDSSTYRAKTEVDEWVKGGNNPITRFRNYLQANKWWDQAREEQERSSIRKRVIEAMTAAEREMKPPVSAMFDDVYAELPWHLQEQKAYLRDLLERHPEDFPQLPRHLPWKD